MKQAKRLLKKYQAGTATQQEKAIVESWYLRYHQPDESDLTPEQLMDEQALGWSMLNEHIQKTDARRIWLRIAAAAIVLLCIGTILYVHEGNEKKNMKAPIAHADILPGGNKATLTLSSGEKISLTDARIGETWRREGLKIKKTMDGQLVYSIAGDSGENTGYHTIETPIGGEYQLNLSDGSKVWLNAASSLRFPTRFQGSARIVELIGEAYFEVTGKGRANQQMPFIVRTPHQEIKVLGTDFNISAYPDDPMIKTTLIAGAVRVSSLVGGQTTRSVQLKPGQKAVSKKQDAEINVVPADSYEDMAWKKGYFIFNNENIQVIMKKLARWYDMDVVYEGDVSDVAFQGNYSKEGSLSNLLNTIELTNRIKFKIEGRRVTVIKQP